MNVVIMNDGSCRTTPKGRRPRAHPPRFFDIGKWGIAEKLRIRVKQWRRLKFEILARKFKFKYLFSSDRPRTMKIGVHDLHKIQKRLK